MTDKLREALETVQQAAADLQRDMDRLAEIKATIRVNALRGGATTDEVEAMVRGEKSFVDFLAKLCDARAALAAAPQPVAAGEAMIENMQPEQFAADVAGFIECGFNPDRRPELEQPSDREALVEVISGLILNAADAYIEEHDRRAIVDALLARGLRLPSGEAKPRRCAECDCEGGEYECTWIKPGPDRDNALQQLADLGQQADRASETMAWAVVGEDGEVIPGSIYPTRDEAERVCDYEGERVVRVTIRVVEGGDDA